MCSSSGSTNCPASSPWQMQNRSASSCGSSPSHTMMVSLLSSDTSTVTFKSTFTLLRSFMAAPAWNELIVYVRASRLSGYQASRQHQLLNTLFLL
mmetsp:Transcript_67278/g.161272  ORF Transcript_67278/g.161272 Transcript_67278/m.161272 type:complete len:95 (-) Transcript_67278:4-288(-)